MARQFTVTLTSGTDSGPYNIYYDSVSSGTLATLCGTSNLAENLTLSQVQSGVCVEVPNNADRIIFYNTNPDIAKDCETNQEVHELTSAPSPTPSPTSTSTPTESSTPTPTPTESSTPTPTPTSTATPTPSPTEDIACQCFEFINTTLGNISYTYTDCNGTSVEAVSDKEPWTFYVCAQSIDSVTNTKLTYSLYGPCTDGVCVNTPSPTPTNTPTPTPTETEPEVLQSRDRKFQNCGTTIGSPTSDEVETQAAPTDGESSIPIFIYLKIDEYGSTPESGDKVRVNFGTSDQHCYEYVGIEDGEENTSLVVEYNDCTCDAPQGVCKFFEVGSEVDQSRYGLNWVPSDSEVGTTATFNSLPSTSLGGEFGSSVAIGVCTANLTSVNIWDSNTGELVMSLPGVSALSQRDSSCDETPLGRCEYDVPDEPTQTNRTVTGCTSGNVYVINHTETCNAGTTQISEEELDLGDVIWITYGDNCGEAVDECATVGQVTNDEVTAIRRGQNIFNGCSNNEGNTTGCFMP